MVCLIQDLYKKRLNRRPTVVDVKRTLRASVTILDGDDESENVQNTGKAFIRVDVISALKTVPPLAPSAGENPRVKGVVQPCSYFNGFDHIDEATGVVFSVRRNPVPLSSTRRKLSL